MASPATFDDAQLLRSLSAAANYGRDTTCYIDALCARHPRIRRAYRDWIAGRSFAYMTAAAAVLRTAKDAGIR